MNYCNFAHKCKISIIASIIGCWVVVSPAQGEESNIDDYLQLSLQDLLSVEVTSVSKTEQSLRDVATAVYVIDSEDIRRSGATSIPEILSIVPGVNVGRITGQHWAVSARGFNDQRANKLLVLLDGRSIYSPFYGGVFWDMQDVLFEDIDRIEVIRGPGGTIWGANAVNGIINIITRHTKETQGSFIKGTFGNEIKSILSGRHGKQIDGNSFYRVYAKRTNKDGTLSFDGTDEDNDIEFLQTGFRYDSTLHNNNTLTFQGDIYRGEVEFTDSGSLPFPPFSVTADGEDLSGGNIMARWEHPLTEGGRFKLQAYIDQTRRDSIILDNKITTYDVEFQHQLPLKGAHALIWGGNFRHIKDTTSDVFTIQVEDDVRENDLASIYLQDEIDLAAYYSKLTLGTKIEHNEYSGTEIQPSARLVVSPNEKQTYWMAVSRAVHTPTRFAIDGSINLYLPFPSPMILTIVEGNEDLDSEKLIAYEAGWRSQITKTFSLDLSMFYNDYDKLRGRVSQGLDTTVSPPVSSNRYENELEGTAHGIEIASTWNISDTFRLRTNYSYLKLKVTSDSGPSDPDIEEIENESPEHQLFFISDIEINKNTDLNFAIKYISEIGSIPAYTNMNANISWRINKKLTWNVAGYNLFDSQHPEFTSQGGSSSPPSEIERSLFSGVRWDF